MTQEGIPKSSYKTIFKPGYHQKAGDGGLDFRLSKRIIEDYHDGQIFVKSSEMTKERPFALYWRNNPGTPAWKFLFIAITVKSAMVANSQYLICEI